MTNIFGTPDLMFTFALGVILSVVFAQGISQITLQTAMSAKMAALHFPSVDFQKKEKMITRM